jgi:hypothetical protein
VLSVINAKRINGSQAWHQCFMCGKLVERLENTVYEYCEPCVIAQRDSIKKWRDIAIENKKIVDD